MAFLHLLAFAILAAGETGAGAILKQVAPPEGFVVADSVVVYKADRLWDYIDGAADVYLRRGVIETGTVSFRRPNAELPAVTIDLHRFLDPKGSYEMYLEERSPEAERLQIGPECSWQNGMLTMWDVTFYARIVSDVPRDSTILFAKALAHVLPTKADALPVYRIFPFEGRVEGSEQVVAKDYLGIPHLDQFYTVRFEDEAGQYELFLGPNRPSAWVSNLGDKGTVKAAPNDASPIHLIELADGRNLIVFYIKLCPFLAGYVGPKPDDARTSALSRWVEALPKQ